ncbi:MAG TPA: hypothetical protein VF470_05795 [Sphingomicrobium sp.]
MRLLTCTAIAAALILSLPACKKQESAAGNEAAASTEAAGSLAALSGTWKTDRESVKFEQKPDEYLLKDGSYSCNTCIPPLTTPADGQFHPVKDRPYYDSMSVKVVDANTVEFHRKKGDKEIGSSVITVAADGKTGTAKFQDATVTPPVNGQTTLNRVGAAPAGAHAISGQWIPEKVNEYSDEALSATYKVEGNKVSWSGQGQSYEAEIGGPAVPITGDIGGTTVQVSSEGGALKETYTRDGKVVNEAVTTVSADGKSINWVSTDPRDGSKVSGTAQKTN